MAKKSSDVLRFCTPANWWGERWREGLFAGNGKIGANVYGGIANEKILVNDSSLGWLGRVNVLPDVAEMMDEVKKRLENDDFKGAQKVLPNALKQKNYRPQTEYSLPLCKISADFTIEGIPADYSRSVEMKTGEVKVEYRVGTTKFLRQLFVSRENGLVIYQISKQGSAPINVDLSLSLMDKGGTSDSYEVSLPDDALSEYDKQYMYFSARNFEDGKDFGLVARIINTGGMLRYQKDCVKVTNASQLMIIAKTFTAASHEKQWIKIHDQLEVVRDTYDKMLKAHQQLHSKLYSSVQLDMSDGKDVNVEQLLLDAKQGRFPPLLAEKLYKYGRYLWVSGSAEGQLFSPIGLWNGNYKPYRSARCFNGEMQMIYLPCLQGRLDVDIEQTFKRHENNLNDYRNNAMRLFGCHGIVVPVVFAPKTGRLGTTDVYAVNFTGCAGWLANFYCKFAVYTQNYKFIKSRLMPFMREVDIFYSEFFQQKNGVLVSSPSALPMRVGDAEKLMKKRPVVAENSALDFAIARDFYENLIEVSKLLSINQSDIAGWEKMLRLIPHQQLNSDGIFKEFVNCAVSNDYTGISTGTVYGAYFGDQINFLSNDDEKDDYMRTAERKMREAFSQNSFSTSILANVFARLEDKHHALLCLENLVNGSMMPNLAFVDKDWRGMGICGSGDSCPVQLHTNMSVTNAVQQMLMYSHGNVIKVLPCIPDDWNVSFSGMMSENGTEVSCAVDVEKSQLVVTLKNRRDAVVDLYLPNAVKKLIKSRHCDQKLTGHSLKCVKDITLYANKYVIFVFKYTSEN